MSCPDTSVLWSLEAGELDAETVFATLGHARGCLACQSVRKELRGTLSLLSVSAQPAVNWSKVDDAVDDALTKQALRRARPFAWMKWVVGPAALAAAALAVIVLRPGPTAELKAQGTELKPVVALVSPVEIKPVVKPAPAKALSSRSRVLTDGDRLATHAEPARFSLAHGGKGELGRASSLRMKAGVLELESGTLLAVATGPITVDGHRITLQRGSVFISRTATFIEVAVSSGAVLVERANAEPQWIHAGESVRFERSAPRQTQPSLSRSAEEQFLGRAEASLKSGRCGEFLFGLDGLAFDAEEPSIRAQARILEARCHEERLEPKAAGIEYRRYLRDFPDGPAANEAREAVARE